MASPCILKIDQRSIEMGDQKVALVACTRLTQGARGEDHSPYRLRHTCVRFMLRYGNGLGLLMLARNART